MTIATTNGLTNVCKKALTHTQFGCEYKDKEGFFKEIHSPKTGKTMFLWNNMQFQYSFPLFADFTRCTCSLFLITRGFCTFARKIIPG